MSLSGAVGGQSASEEPAITDGGVDGGEGEPEEAKKCLKRMNRNLGRWRSCFFNEQQIYEC